VSKAVFLSPEPILTDFPAAIDEAVAVMQGLARVTDLQLSGDLRCIMTEASIASIGWNNRDYSSGHHRLTAELISHLTQLAASPLTIKARRRDVVAPRVVHPVPRNLARRQGASRWSEDVGAQFANHNLCCQTRACVGVASLSGFGKTDALEPYEPPGLSAFPLVDERSLDTIADAEEWVLLAGDRTRRIGERELRRNFRAIGASGISSATKHERLLFPNGDDWIFDKKWGNVWPARFVKQLAQKVRLPADVLTHALIYGKLPARRVRPCIW
jgi:hypothetical protein